ncbi:MAG TPA: rRNA maturation RNase YbeY [Acidimicrobiales bacterium]|jgi:probable rRNA maturation factor|nr:rRNA maturation RNase YbeY [Acidimicrobiales bacterium]
MGTPVVVGYDEQELEPVDLDRWVRLAQDVLVHEGAAEGELALLFVDEDTIADLNAQHMGDAEPTDVLSFPIDAEGTDGGAADGVPLLLGDVVVCPGVARRNAPGHAGSYEDELALLVVHGVLHVLGHDHAARDEAAAMQQRERSLLERFHQR